jgi:hypothetical protein
MSKRCDNCIYKVDTKKIFVNECELDNTNIRYFSLDHVCDCWKLLKERDPEIVK